MEIIPPFVPNVSSVSDTRFVDPGFLKMPIEEDEDENSFEEVTYTNDTKQSPPFQNFTYIPN